MALDDPYVIGPYGERMTRADLPKPGVRWVVRRKAQIVVAVEGGLISREEVCARYDMSLEELNTWWRDLDQWGLPGLRATRLQAYREKAAR